MGSAVWRPQPSDWVIAAGIAVAVMGHAALEPADRSPTLVDFVLLAVASFALVALRRAPLVVLAVSSVCVFIYLVRVGTDVVSVLPVLIAIYTVVREGHRILGPLAAAPFAIGALLNADTLSEGILPMGWFVAAALLGETHRQLDANIKSAQERAAEAERTRDEVAARRASEERLRIARDLHDSLTHSISVVKVQAGVAIHLARKRGEPVPDALLAIQQAATDASRELRATLYVLRDDPGAGNGLDRLPELVARARSAGLDAAVAVSGEPRLLPATVDEAAYRIVQEALTNVSRHAGTTSATVTLSYGADELTVRIEDRGETRPNNGALRPGVGLIGMRERVTALGGWLDAGPRPEGGFTVLAGLPVDAEPGR